MTYTELAKDARRTILKMIYEAQTSHIGSNFSVIDILAVLYKNAKISPEDWENRDRIILSKGWAAASLYYFLAHKGIIPREDLATYCKGDSKYIGLAEPTVKGVEAAGGAMGHGLPMGVGMALAAKRAGWPWKVYVVMSDGEMNCGTSWESSRIALQHNLDNLTVIVDMNKWQALGRTKDILDCDTDALFKGWRYRKIDGHSHEMIAESLLPPWWVKYANGHSGPKVLIADTVKGKGVSFMEDKLMWHYKNIDDDSYKKAMAELA